MSITEDLVLRDWSISVDKLKRTRYRTPDGKFTKKTEYFKWTRTRETARGVSIYNYKTRRYVNIRNKKLLGKLSSKKSVDIIKKTKKVKPVKQVFRDDKPGVNTRSRIKYYFKKWTQSPPSIFANVLAVNGSYTMHEMAVKSGFNPFFFNNFVRGADANKIEGSITLTVYEVDPLYGKAQVFKLVGDIISRISLDWDNPLERQQIINLSK